ncbi:MAG TPA: hypothetical protein VN721_12215 [Flavipsychrobacter sp.]|nr:hypothetical protein [Flavipsychrobacter sp.]
MDTVLDLANKYAEGLKKVEERRAKWLKKSEEIKSYLTKVASDLNEKADYKPGYYVDIYYPYSEEIKGHCFHMPSIGFRSGNTPIGIVFENESGSTMVYSEKGFQIIFNPVLTGQIIVGLNPHINDFIKSEPQFTTITVVDDPDQLTNEEINRILLDAMEQAYYSSYTGLAETDGEIKSHAPIGFKKFETTEPEPARLEAAK